MSYQYLYCPTCGQRRSAVAFRCLVCNGPVRHSARPHRVHTAADAGHARFSLGWHRVASAKSAA